MTLFSCLAVHLFVLKYCVHSCFFLTSCARSAFEFCFVFCSQCSSASASFRPSSSTPHSSSVFFFLVEFRSFAMPFSFLVSAPCYHRSSFLAHHSCTQSSLPHLPHLLFLHPNISSYSFLPYSYTRIILPFPSHTYRIQHKHSRAHKLQSLRHSPDDF